MDAWEVLRALKAGEISVEDAKKKLTQPQDSPPTPACGSPPATVELGERYGLVLSTVHRLDELALQEWQVPEPSADELTIRVHASAVNFPDTMCVRGLYPTMPDYPFVPGFEVSGVVARVGSRDSEFREGDAVIALTGLRLGGHAAWVNVPLANVVHKPANMSFEDACSLPVAFSTVHYAFEKAGLRAGEHVLIQTATGGCGLVALQLARLQGCVCYGTSSRAEKLTVLRRLGVAHAINYQQTEFDREIRRLTDGRGVDVVLNMLSGDGIQRGLNCLAPSGRYLELAVHALKAGKPLDLSRLVQNQTIHSIDLRQAGVHAGVSTRDMLSAMVTLLEEGRLSPIVSRVYPLRQIGEALTYVAEGRHIGKVVISHSAEHLVDRTEECIQCLVGQQQRAAADRARARPLVVAQDYGRGHDRDPRAAGIAIIGMAGRFPLAPTLADFWQNVAQGRDCIAEIPPWRWPLAHFYDPDPKAPGKTYGKWMGVLEDIDKFDPLFFSISPAEAELMDPQQRLFLENSWHCLEDAGLSPASLSGARCGVFVGCAPSDYGQFTGTGGMNAQGLLGGSTSILSARISYLLNLKGPCLSIDTACSASLVAIAEACNALVLGDCDLALAGGVCVMPGPGAHIMTSKAGMLSKDGRCFTFDQRANGFVPGEGVGVVLLKRLTDALRDGDPIYGVIRGWGVNQDGKTNGITAPSVSSQISLETGVYRRFGIDPSTISLVEAHGTGTKLGDPIEVEALTASFRAFTDKVHFCALGSVKSNIGHLLAAAGVSGLVKVLQALQHRMLPPTINFETLNEHIDLHDSPFYVNTALRPWPAEPRRAAVSTFGFSGTNAHLVVEEYAPEPEPTSGGVEPDRPSLFLLSARTEERLSAYAALMRDCIASRPELSLPDLAYTSQVGRDALEHRLAICATSRQALLDGLASFMAQRPAAGVFVGRVRKSKGGTVILDGTADGEAALQSWREALTSGDAAAIAGRMARVAALWVQGLEVDWRRFHEALRAAEGRVPRRLRLPGYPFARERCWIPDVSHLHTPATGATTALHPLVHRNTSTFSTARFSSTFSAEECFLADHVIDGKRFLPAVAYLEMARAALALAEGQGPPSPGPATTRLTDVVWVRPVTVGVEPVEVHLRLRPEGDGRVTFEVYSEVDDAVVVHCRGTAARLAADASKSAPYLNLIALQRQCRRGQVSGEQCYQAFQAMRMTYGPGHRGIQALYLGTEDGSVQVLAQLALPEHLRADLEHFVLHPCLLDSALQASIGFAFFPLPEGEGQDEGGREAPQRSRLPSRIQDDFAGAGGAGSEVPRHFRLPSPQPSPGGRGGFAPTSTPAPALPFAIESVDIFGACTPVMWAVLREARPSSGVRKLDIDLCDEAGNVRVRIRGYASRSLRKGREELVQAIPTAVPIDKPLTGLHPLLDADVFQDGTLVFAKRFSNNDAILRDHVFDGVRVLPAAAIIEMARAAVARSGAHPRRLTNFVMGYPIVGTDHGVDTRLTLQPAADRVDFTLSSRDPESGQHLIHCQGTVETDERGSIGDADRLDLKAIRTRLPQRADLEHDYDTVVPHAVQFGPTLRTLREFYYGDGEALAKIASGEACRENTLVMHPLILDGAFQAGAVAYYHRRRGFQPSVLFSIERLEMLAPTGNACHVHLTLLDSGDGDTMAFDATICDETGRIVARLTRITLKVVAQPSRVLSPDDAPAAESHTPLDTPTHTEVGAKIRREDDADLFQRAQAYLQEAIAGVVKIPAPQIDAQEDFGRYGIDSLTIMQLNDRLSGDFQGLPRTLFFEYITVHDLTAYFVAHHAERLKALFRQPTASPLSLGEPNFYSPLPPGEPDRQSPLPPGEGQGEGASEASPQSRLPSPQPSPEGRGGMQPAPALLGGEPPAAPRPHDIAVVGLAGRYPGAERLEQFWENLQLGRDCVTEIPAGAWDYRALYDPERRRPHSIACKWGGFIKDADKFDPLFFHISPLEAETLDPQARIFLETAWHCVEDAGYAPRRFAALFPNRNVGVFVGVSTNEYQLLKLPTSDIDIHGVAYLFSVANRVSYHLGLHGPSLSVDTACSSSLSAIHMACKSIIHGECEAAIAGGVNLSLHPHKYQYLSQGNFLASDGRCRSFGAGGDGYVPGEGVGAVLLKPLARAIADGDHIYGVIKGSAINHGGKTSGFTVPNPKAQAQLIRDALRDAGVDPRSITYVEAHGTGTELGDPIEIAGLAEAFAHANAARQFCAIGSCKSNIGHLEAAAGIAQLTKVLLQLQHRQLVPSIHTHELNPNIDFASTPFYVQRQLSAWEPAALEGNSGTHACPRRAGISSFGVGGANAHLIVEEYVPPRRPRAAVPPQPWLLVLSAATAERLRAYAGELADFLAQISGRDEGLAEGEVQRDLVELVHDLLDVPEVEIDVDVALGDLGFDATALAAFAERLNGRYGLQLDPSFCGEYPTIAALAEYLGWVRSSSSSLLSLRKRVGVREAHPLDQAPPPSPSPPPVGEGVTSLRDLTYTLQVGREPLEERLAFSVASVAEAVEVLRRFQAGERSIAGLYRGNARKGSAGLPDGSAVVVADLLRQRAMDELARLWVAGLEVDWRPLYDGEPPLRLSLPTYPFARERYWLPQAGEQAGPRADTATVPALHPLLQRNTSDFSEQRFSSSFIGREFFLADHRLHGRPVLPAVAYLEMARAAVALTHGGLAGLRLRNVVWARPFVAVEAQSASQGVDSAGLNQVHIGLALEEDGTIGYEIHGEPASPGDEPPLYCQGHAMVAALDDRAETPALDLVTLRQRCDRQVLDAAVCYKAFKGLGLDYGPAHRGIEALYVGTDCVLARLRLPAAVAGTLDKFVLHPSLLDAALQAAIGLTETAERGAAFAARPTLPFALDELEIFGPCTPEMWALVRYSDGSGSDYPLPKLDIDLCDDEGRRCVSFRGLACRPLGEDRSDRPHFGTLLLAPTWRIPAADQALTAPDFSRHLAIFCELSALSRADLAARLAGTEIECIVSDAPEGNDPAARFQAHLTLVFAEVQALLRARPQGSVLVQVVLPGMSEEQSLFGGIAALLKTAHLENPNLVGQVIEVRDDPATWHQGLAMNLLGNRQRCRESHILYRDGMRLVAGWERLAALPNGMVQEVSPLPWKDDGVYLITGGAGGLGLLFAEEIARRTARATVILAGRSPLTDERRDRLQGICARFPRVRIDYRQADVTHQGVVTELLQWIRRTFGDLHGIVHGAGVLRDNFLLKKRPEELRAVLAPKVMGLVNLDRASHDCDLDCFLLCSSGSAAEGNAGQADYAAANAFMDAYAAYRNRLAAAGQRRGWTLSVNWPLWQDGGMRVERQTEDLLRRMGMLPVTTEAAFRALYRALASGRDQVWVLEGDLERLQALFEPAAANPPLPLGEGRGEGGPEPAPGSNVPQPSMTMPGRPATRQTAGPVPRPDFPHPNPLPEGEGTHGFRHGRDAPMGELVVAPGEGTHGLRHGEDTLTEDLVSTPGQGTHGLRHDQPDHLAPTSMASDVWDLVEAWVGGTDLAPTSLASDPVGPKSASAGAALADERLRTRAVAFFRNLLASAIKLPAERIEADVPLEQYGIDSILVVQMTKELEKVFGSLSKTLFFEYQNIGQLTDYFVRAYADQLQELLGMPSSPPAARAETASCQQPAAAVHTGAPGGGHQHRRFTPSVARQDAATGQSESPLDIAIIGLAGRYPMAANLEEFWANLQAGRDCITEIPRERWDHRRDFDADRRQSGKTYSKWGGFLDGVDRFDPLFFNISPREAELMDPQERLFLECAYEAIEDAGYTRASLAAGASARHPGGAAPVGVYVGVMYEEYQLYGAQAQARGKPLALPGSPSSIANRVSYVCNFHGPSLAVDTMCSSSLTAIHLACESLKRGECELAIAGGVNVSIHPNKYLLLSQGRFVSSTGRCTSFGEGGDGYVPGEGVGAVLLKPWRRAVTDGDHIYGVIKGSAINHGGKTNGYSVPNPHAQADAVAAAFKRAGVDPRTMSYLEAHGTGTALGDPIEIGALTQVFREYTADTQFCAIGSVKSNIGHCESAAGIAGLTKVLLQLQHRQLVPSLHSSTLNPNIDFAHSPFSVLQTLMPWPRPQVAARADQGRAREYPRLAGISSFGAGGSNAHMVIEEYVPDAPTTGQRNQAPALIPLSAKNEERLLRVVANLHRFLTHEPQPDLDLAALAYTLQVGREAMEERLALLVNSLDELTEKLAAILAGAPNAQDLYRGTAGGMGWAERETLALVGADEDLQAALDAWIAKGKYESLLSLWVKGLSFDWRRLYGVDTPHGAPPRRLSLPTYPFDRQRYWLPEIDGGDAAPQAETMHPLLHRNTSDLAEQRFSTVLSGREFFIADHRVQGQTVLPGVAQLEMAREAVERAACVLLVDGEPSPTVRLEQVVWARPAIVTHAGLSLHTALYPEERPQTIAPGEVRVAYEIYRDDAGEGKRLVYGRGYAVLEAAPPARSLQLDELRSACDRGVLAADQCYTALAAMGLEYGPTLRTIEALHLGADQVLARLCLPPSIADTGECFMLHPSLLDGALQAALGLYVKPHDAGGDILSRPALPFAVEGVEVLGACTPIMWAHIRRAGDGKGDGGRSAVMHPVDIDLCDENGLVRVRLRGLASRVLDGEAGGTAADGAAQEVPEAVRTTPQRAAQAGAEPSTGAAAGAEALLEKTVSYFKQLLASTLKLPAQQIRADEPLEQYGIDSVMVMELTGLLEQSFGPLSKTLFFEYQDLLSLSRYFVEAYAERLNSLLAVEAEAGAPAVGAGASPSDTSTPSVSPALIRPARPRFAQAGTPQRPPQGGALDIAIIGLAGRYPGARNIWEFWRNLQGGRDCITEIPRGRWDHDRYFDVDRYKPGKTYGKWGGFLDGVDEFDPRFFNIAPREAEFMDPQERLFLQCVYAVLEDAGYTREGLARYQNLGLPGNIGVYVGVMYEEYQLYGTQETLQGHPLVLSGSPSSIANRVSYFCNFHGPSLAVDTMCSSSLTAIHLACESMVRGGCELAVAGGVNVSIHPNKFIGLGQGQYLSSQGRCASFGAGGDGYVPGEGVGAVLLKPLARAVADGDHIYGVIKGSAVNHGGKTNGYSVPNPNAQASVIGQVFMQTGIDPRTVSYLEAHGTGTALGDPIEIAALTKAFRDYTPDAQFCAIGSVKSNIGHCESAAGIAGLTKILLQLQHRQLVPSLHSETPNPHIDFANSPFVVQRSLEAWRRPVLGSDGQTREYPRLAGLSSFGAGGSNAHLLVEEYLAEAAALPDRHGSGLHLIVLSAKNAERLREVVADLHQAVSEEARYGDDELPAIAYTLQVGREAMAERLAFSATSVADLAAKLQACLGVMSGTDPHALERMTDVFRGRASGAAQEALTALAADEELQQTVETWLQRGKYGPLLRLWVEGLSMDWHKLYGEDAPYGLPPRRISLPTYPFAREHYWVPKLESGAPDVAAGEAAGTVAPPAMTDGAGTSGARLPQPSRQVRTIAPASAGSPRIDSPATKSIPMTHERLLERTTAYLQEILASVLKITPDQIEADVPMEEFGIDSVMVMQVTNHLERTFGSLSKTLFFEYRNIQALSDYFVTAHGDALAELFDRAEGKPPDGAPATADIPPLPLGEADSGGHDDSTQSSQALLPPLPRGEADRGRDDDSTQSSQALLPPLPLGEGWGEGGSKPAQGSGSPHPPPLPVGEREVRMSPRRGRPEIWATGPLDIAIIGLAGRYPGANDLAEFWRNLRAGRDCIGEIPRERWDHARYGEGNAGKWGGFLDGVDRFDPLFFNIAPLEAEYMDPQERLFLECVYETIEDAGYTRASLAASAGAWRPGAAAPVGVYVGVMCEEYQLFGVEAQVQGRPLALSGMSGSVANRVSYFCNFDGPSLAVNTMCSSSLTAIHLACQSLALGECELAIAGGVSVSIHPNKYIGLARGKFLAGSGRCQAFGAGADGYVPGEGVGAVLLKPLARAVADGDHIYGVIKGSAVNHGAKSNGYTVPNPAAQAEVIGRALRQAGVDPRRLGYLEAHGTGTVLGDPIELTALTRAIGAYTGDRQFCAIGSVKSNIGHCEGAAGIAGLTKVLLQLQYRQLVPSLHTETLNPHIDFAQSPFVVQRQVSPWPQPVSADAGQAREYPRVAGVSSFGAGGSNAHLVIEEYLGEARPSLSSTGGTGSTPALIVLSAKDEERLREQAQRLLGFVAAAPVGELDLADVAYTLQVGREAMPQRLALIVTSLDDMQRKLTAYLRGDPTDGLFLGRAVDRPLGGMHRRSGNVEQALRREQWASGLLSPRERAGGEGGPDQHTTPPHPNPLLEGEGITAAEATGKAWIARGAFADLLASWVQGVAVDWHRLYGEGQAMPRRISLPTYPFARQRYWVPGLDGDVEEKGAIAPATDGRRHNGERMDHDRNGTALIPALHPLLHRNTSTLTGTRFSTAFIGHESFLADHVIQGRPVLPAVVYLEMARAAATCVMGEGAELMSGVRLRHVVWAQPLECGEAGAGHVHVHLCVTPAADGRLDFEIASEPAAGASVVHSRGSIVLDCLAPAPHLDLTALRLQCSQGALSAEQCYQTFRAIGIDYGLAHRAIDALYVGADRVLAKLVLPAGLADERLVLHPSLLDGALQATIGLSDGSTKTASPGLTLPFALDELEVYGACAATMWAFIRDAAGGRAGSGMRKLDIDLMDETGTVRLRMRGFSLRVLPAAPPRPMGEGADGGRLGIPSPGGRGEGEGGRAGARAEASLTPSLSRRERENEGSGSYLMLVPHWQERGIAADAVPPVYTQRLAILCEVGAGQGGARHDGGEAPATTVGSHTDGTRYLHLRSAEETVERRFQTYALRIFEELQRILANRPGGKVLIQLAVPGRGEGRLCAGLAGLLRTASLENPNLVGQIIEVDEHTADLAELLRANARSPLDQQIRYRDGKRLVASWGEVEAYLSAEGEGQLPWRDRGVYLITGGAGGLGLIFAEEIVQRVRGATVILAGRSAPDERTRLLVEMLSAMGTPGTCVDYRRLDVSQSEAVARLVRDITDTYGGLHGVIHSAGVTRDNFIMKKDPQELVQVLAPKVAGCLHLDQACQDLDFLVLFSSIAGALGNPGQADYAAANAFMDAFAHYRNALVHAHKRRGRTLSIDWPLWREGGMGVDPSLEKLMQQHTGLVPMSTATGLAAFYRGLALGTDQVMVLEGDLARVRRSLGLMPGADVSPAVSGGVHTRGMP